MIDFQNGSIVKLREVGNNSVEKNVAQLLIPGEEIVSCYKGIRDFVVFTNKRIIVVNVQGVTGKKKDYSSLPYSKIQAFSVETAGHFDLDSELELWYSSLGKITLEFTGSCDLDRIAQIIGEYALK